MQNIEYDMDDLFRKAAEDYPLKSGDSNWESVSKKIAEHNYEAKPARTTRTGISRKYINLIFLFIGLTGGWFIFKNTGVKERIFPSVKNDAVLSNPVNNINKPSSENVESKTNATVNNSNQNKKQHSVLVRPGRSDQVERSFWKY